MRAGRFKIVRMRPILFISAVLHVGGCIYVQIEKFFVVSLKK